MKIRAKIYKKSSTGKWTLNYIHPKTGKRTRKSFKYQKDATTYLEELKRTLVTKKNNGIKNISTAEIIDIYTKNYLKTAFLKNDTVFNLFKIKFGRVSPHEITPSKIRSWMIELQTENGYSIKTLQNVRDQVNVFFRYLLRNKYIQSNPLKKIVFRNRVDYYKRNKLSESDISLILENLGYYSPQFLYRIAYILYYTGISLKELVEIKWENIIFNEQRINIVCPDKGFVRSVKIENHVAKFLQGSRKTCEYVMTNKRGKKIQKKNVGRYFKKFREAYADTPEFCVDDLKNASAIHYLKRGGTIKELSLMLGHSSVHLTSKLYSSPKRIPTDSNPYGHCGIEIKQ